MAEHRLHTGIVEVVTTIGELTQNDAAATVENTRQPEHVDLAVDVVHRLFHLLDEEDDIFVGRGIGAASHDRGESHQVASHKGARGLACDIHGVSRYLITRHNTLQQVAHQRAGRVHPSFGQERAHGAVDTHHACARLHLMQRGDITESDQPFGMGGHFFHKLLTHEMDGAITAAVADNGLDGGVVECPLQVAENLVDGAGIFSGERLSYIGTHNRIQSPGTKHVGRLLHILHGGEVRR